MPTTTLCRAMAPARLAMDGVAEPVEAIDGEHDVGGLGGRGRRPRPDGDADVGAGERGGVVDAVADHDRGPGCALRARRRRPCRPGCSSASTSSTPITAPTVSATSARSPVTMTTRRMPARRKLADGAGGVGADRVVEQEARRPARRRCRRTRVRPHRARLAADRRGPPGSMPVRRPSGLADRDRRPDDGAADAAPGTSSTPVGRSRRELARRGRPGRWRRPARGATPGRATPRAAGRSSAAPSSGDDVGERRSADREGAGLVEEQHLGPGRGARGRRRP